MRLLLLLLALLLGGCPRPAGDDGASGDDSGDNATAEPCTGVAPLEAVYVKVLPAYMSTLDQAAAGIEIPYTVAVSRHVANAQPEPQDPGNCGHHRYADPVGGRT